MYANAATEKLWNMHGVTKPKFILIVASKWKKKNYLDHPFFNMA